MFDIIREEKYQKDRTIYKEGDPSREVYVILSGAVKLVKEMRSENLVVEVMRTGDIFGAMSFVTRSPRNATVRTMGETVVGIINHDPLEKEADQVSYALSEIMKSLARRLKKATESSGGVSFIRKEPRVLEKLSVAFEKEDFLVETTSHDVSLEGMFIKTDKPFKKGRIFLLKLGLPGDEGDLWIRCQVAWVRHITDNPKKRPIGMGVKFDNLSSQYALRLRSLIESA